MIGLASMIFSPSSFILHPQHAVGGRVLGPEADLHLLDVEERILSGPFIPRPLPLPKASSGGGPPPGGYTSG